MPLWLDNDTIAGLLDMPGYVEVLERAYRALAAGEATERIVSRTHTYLPRAEPDSAYLFKSIEGGLHREGVYALRLSSDVLRWTEVGGVRRREKLPAAPGGRYLGLVLLFSAETGELLAMMQDGWMNRQCTGATGGLGARYLAVPEAGEVGLLGAGWQARGQLAAVCAVWPIRRVRVYSPTAAHREAFAEEMSAVLDVPVEPVTGPEEAVAGAPIVVVATSAVSPAFFGRWFEAGMLVISIAGGAGGLDRRREVDDETIVRADVVVTVSKNQAVADRQGDLFEPIVEGRLHDWEAVRELAPVVAGAVPGRTTPHQRVFFKHNTGLGLWYAASGHELFRRARAAGLGQELPHEWFLESLKP